MSSALTPKTVSIGPKVTPATRTRMLCSRGPATKPATAMEAMLAACCSGLKTDITRPINCCGMTARNSGGAAALIAPNMSPTKATVATAMGNHVSRE